MAVGNKAVRAFRKFARLCPDWDSLSGFEVSDRIRGSLDEREAAKIVAVYDTLKFLRATGHNETVSAVRSVYFTNASRVPRKSEITLRVRRFAEVRHIDDRTVWRKLTEAEKLYLKLAETK